MQARLLRVVRRGILAREAARRCRAWREHLETFLAGEPMPGFVVDELRDYLRCGVLALGAVRFACEHCGNDRLVGISCKGRGFCPRCLGRKMTEMARYWVRAVLPRVRTRQSVLSLPFELRVPLAYRHELTLAVHRMAARAIEDWYRDKGREIGIVDGRTGSITAVDTRDKPAALQPLAAAMRTSTASPRSCRHCLFRRRVSLDVDPDLAFDPPVADISILAPEARRLIVIRRPDVPIQTKVLVELDPRVGRADRLDQLDQAIRDSADLRNLVELAVSLRRHASWNDKVSAARTEAERLLAKWYPPPIEVEKTPAFAKAVVALAGAALYLARQGRAFRSPPYLDAVFVAWLFTRIGRGSPEESLAPRTLRDRVVLVWGPRTVDPDVHPNPDRLAVRPNLDSLRREAGNARSLLEEFYRTPASRSGPLSGNAMLALRGVAPGLADHLGAANTVADALTLATAVSSAPSAPPPPEPALLGVHVGDLFVTRSRLAGYQIADISRIETILANETRERTHTRRTLVETEETTDEEQTRETESDLQQTTREEVRTEQRKDEESELQVSAGGGVSASFGTALSVEAHFDVSSSNSKSLSESLARTTSTETTRRAIDRARSRVLRQLRTRSVEEVTEVNRHLIVSATGSGDKQGFYRWLEKRIEVSLYNLGSRTIYSFSVEDPSASYRAANAAAMPTPPGPPVIEVKVYLPPPLGSIFPPLTTTRPLEPTDIARDNYLKLVAGNEARGANPPPPEFQTVSLSFAGATKDGSASQQEVDLPDGYECYRVEGTIEAKKYEYTPDTQSDTKNLQKGGFIGGVFGFQQPSETESSGQSTTHTQPIRTGSPVAHLVVAGHSKHEGQTLSITSDSSNELETALGPKVSVSARSLGDFALDVTLYCRLRTEVFEAWQLETHRAIMAGFEARQTRFKNAMTGLTRTTIEIQALRTEMQRLALRGILRGASPPAAVRVFLEQAFDWKNIIYQLIDGEAAAGATSNGSMLGAFLRAVVARIDLPVRIGFEGLAAAYMQSDPMLVPDNPVSEEGGTGLDAALEAPVHEKPAEELVGTPWIELLPTDLVFVQKDTDVTDIFDADGNKWKAS